MVNETILKMENAAVKKVNFLKSSILKYFLLSMMAGVYVAFGVVLVFSIGAPLKEVGSPMVKTLMGASFGVALTLVIFAGSELFTGNNLVMTIGSLSKKVTWGQTIKLWVVCFTGNLVGSIIFAYLMSISGLIDTGSTKEFIIAASNSKASLPALQLFIRGIFCNMLVTLAVWTAARAESDIGKLALIFWALFAFIGSGFEHSIANMSIMGMAIFENGLTWVGLARNLTYVTLGNLVGGAIFIGAMYWFVANTKQERGRTIEN